jgi:hypothetical protein
MADSKSDMKNEREDNDGTACTIIFKNNEKTILPKSVISRFGLLMAQESKDNTYDLHTINIKDFMILISKIFAHAPTAHLTLSGESKALYDYLDTDQKSPKNKKQFINMITNCFHDKLINTKHGSNIFNHVDSCVVVMDTMSYYNDVGNIKICCNGEDPLKLFVSMCSSFIKESGITSSEYEYYACIDKTKEKTLISNEIIPINKNGLQYDIICINNSDIYDRDHPSYCTCRQDLEFIIIPH